MNLPTPTSPSASPNAQASPAASAAGKTTSAVPTSTAVSSSSTEKLSVTKYHALHKEKHVKKSYSLVGILKPAVYLIKVFGEEYEDIVDYYDDNVEEGSLKARLPLPCLHPKTRQTHTWGLDDLGRFKFTAPRTNPPERAPWMPTEAEIHDQFGASSPPNPILLYSCNSTNDDDVAAEVVFESETQRRDYYIGLFHELRDYAAKKTSRKSKVPEWQTRCQSWNAFVENFNKDPNAYLERVSAICDRYYTYTTRGNCERLHDQSMEARIPCAVPFGTFCPGCQHVSPKVIYTLVRVPDHIKELRGRLESR